MLEVIEFIKPAISSDDEGIAYRAIADSERVFCRFSTECLQDVNPNLRCDIALRQSDASRETLLRIAEEKARAVEILNGLVQVSKSNL